MPENTNICACSDDEVKLIFACSGAADVGHLSDLAARRMMQDGCGKMFCLAGIGGDVEGILKTTRDADKILAIDGCPIDCTKKCLERVGIDNFSHFQITALGFKKGKTIVDDPAVRKVADHGKAML